MRNFTLRLLALGILLLSSVEGISQTIGNALYFDGNNDYVGTNPPPVGSMQILDGTFTVEAWVMPMHATKTMTILSTRQPQDYGFDMKVENGNSVKVDVGGGGTWLANASFSYNYEIKKWMHVAFVADNASNYRVYINGDLVGSGPLSTYPMLINNQHSVRIGTYANEYFEGAIDEIRIFITARTGAQIKADMMMQAPVNDNNYLMSYYDFNEGIAGGGNGNTTHLPDRRNNHNAFTVNFAFNGTTSNWISSFAAITPTAIAPTNRAATQFTANWTAPTNATATDYLLDVSTTSNFSSYVGSYHDVVVSGTSYTVTGLTAGTVYYYRVRARNAAQHASVASNTVMVNNLNILDLAGASAYVASPAYSLRKLSSSYNGKAINVRRNSDNATLDIGFVNGNLDTAALLSFVGSGSAFVTKWYDQSNGNLHAAQTNTNLQPRIVNFGIVEQLNKRPAVYFGTANLFTDKVSMFDLGATLIASAKGSSSTLATLVSKTGFANGTNANVPAPFDFTNSTGAFMVGNGNGFNSNSLIGNGVESSVLGSVYSFMMYNNAGTTTAYSWRNGNGTGGVSNVVYGDGGNSLMIGNRNDNGGSGNMYVSEIVMGNGQTNERYPIETSQIGYYANTNANLSAIALSAGTVSPAVSASEINYTAAVTNATTSIVITPTVSDATAASMSYRIGVTAAPTNLPIGSSTAALPLNEGNTTIQLFVTAQNGVTLKTYTITVFRGSGNNNLSGLTTSAGTVSPAFTSATTSYNTSKTALASVTITPTLADANATIQARINGGSYSNVTSGNATSAMALNVGNNTVEVKVTAVDLTTKIYTIGITRVVPNVLDLIGLTSATPSVPAYSVRKLSSSYNGPAFTVRKTGGTYDYDVNFDTDGNIYEGPLLSYAQGATVNIIKWYDQSGFGYDAVQTNVALQPIIAEGGALKKINGRPAIYFGTANLATEKQYMFESGASMVGFAKGNSSTPSSLITKTGTFEGNNLAHPGPFDFTNNGGQFTVGNAATTSFNHIAMSGINPRADVSTAVPASIYAFTIPTSGTYTTYRNGVQTAVNTILDYKDNGNSLMLGNRNSGGSGGEIYTSEMIMFNSVLTTAQRQAVEAAQTNYYLSTNANLTSIYVGIGTISPTFNSNTTSYNLTLSSGTTSMNVGGTLSSPFGSIKVRSNNGTFAAINNGFYGIVSLVEGTNTVEIQVTSQGGTVKTYTISVLVLSDNANLSGLTTTAGTIAFDSNTTSYGVLITPLTSITITPTAAQSNAAISVRLNAGSYIQVPNGTESIALPLSLGMNDNIYIRVIAQNGYSEKNYRLEVKRLSNNANLRTLTSSYTSIPFSEGTQSYAVTVPSYNPSFTFNTSVYTNATMQLRLNGGSYNTVNPGNQGPFILSIGLNTFDIKITAEDGITEKVYTLAVTKISNNATLSDLVTSPTGIITFASGTETYNANVSNGTSSITVTPTTAYTTSTMQISLNGATFTTIGNTTSSGTLNLNVGLNTIVVKVTAEDTSITKTYTLNITRISNNADLSALTSTAGSFTFASETTQYNLAPVGNATASITVCPTVSQTNATVQVRVNNGTYATVSSAANSGALGLNVGNNDIDVLVTAQDGTTTKSYRISVRRQSNDATLSSLITLPSNIISFASATETYTANVPNATSSITVTPKVTQGDALIQISLNGSLFLSVNDNTASGALNLNIGANVILIKVTAEDSSFTKTYTLNLTRVSSDATLSALTTTAGSFTFSSATQSYNLPSVSNATTSVTVNPTVSNANATVQVRINDGNLQTVNSGSNSTALPLIVGTNIIDVIVSAQDGTSQAYTLTFRRRSNDASLSALSVSEGTLSFAPATLSYSISVASATETLNITPTAAYSSHAVISARLNNGSYAIVNSGTIYAASLIYGINTIEIKVVAEDGNEKNYTIYASRLSENANLSGLTTSSGSIAFDANTISYSNTVGFATTSVTVTPTVAQANAVIDVRINNGNYTRLTSGTTSNALALNLGANTVDIRVTSQNGTVKTYSVNAYRQAANANLSSLTISSGTAINFAQATTTYSTTVSNATTSFTVNSVAADANASIQISVNNAVFTSFENASRSDVVALNVGNNTVVLKVRAEDTAVEKTYTLNVLRLSNNVNLSDLTTTAGSISFDAATLNYSLNVNNATNSVTVTPTTSEATQTVAVRVNNGNYTTVTSGNASGNLGLNIGNNTIDIRVNAQDASTKTYTISIFRPSNNADLSGLSTSDGSLTDFSSETTEYAITVSNETSLLTVNSIASDSNAIIQISINGTAFTSSANAIRSDEVSLIVGENVILIKVIAQDLTEKVYTVNVLRVSNDANLSNLVTSAGTINFTPANVDYTIVVPTEISAISVTPTQSHNSATIEVVVNATSYGFITSGDTITDLPVSIGDNTVEIKVTAQDGTLKVYTIFIKRQSDDATLSSLQTDSGSLVPNFASETIAYNVTTLSGTENIVITAQASNSGATKEIRINNGTYVAMASNVSDALPLQTGINTIDIQVTSENGSVEVYTLTVLRPSDESNLSTLTTSIPDFPFNFNANTFSYATTVTATTNFITIAASASQANAVVEISANGGNYYPVNNSVIPLNVSSNTINIRVTAQNGVTTKTYTLNITRNSATTLDVLGLTSATPAANAYSLRRLSSAFTGSVVKVRRSSDNAMTDIGFNGNGDFDSAALLAFAGNGTAYVVRWYDQSGAGVDLFQDDYSSQPILAENGAMKKFNNKSALFFNGKNLQTNAGVLYQFGASMVATARGLDATPSTLAAKTSNNFPAPFDFTNTGGDFVAGSPSNFASRNTLISNPVSGVFENVKGSTYAFTISNTGNFLNYVNGFIAGNINADSYNDNGDALRIGNRNDFGGYSNMELPEIVFFGKPLSNQEREAIETSQKNYYQTQSAQLTALTLSVSNLNSLFNSSNLSYTANIPFASASITVKPVGTGTIEVSVNGGAYSVVTSNTNSQQLPLNPGENTIKIRVTGDNLVTVYSIKAIRTGVCPYNFDFYSQQDVDNFGNNYPECTTTNSLVRINGNITSLQPFQNLVSIAGLDIRNTSLLNFNGLQNLKKVGYLFFMNNEALQNVDALTGLTETGRLDFHSSNNLTSFAGFQNITKTNGSVYLAGFNSAPNLDGFQNLKTINGALTIRNFPLLTSLAGIANIESEGLTSLSVYYNNELEHANVKSVCEYIAAGGDVQIYINKYPGFAGSTADVTADCGNTINSANLSALTASAGAFPGSFDENTTGYVVSNVPFTTNTTTVTPTTEHPNATVKVRINGGSYATVASGSASQQLALIEGSNTIEITVTAENPAIEKTYTITISRIFGCPDGPITLTSQQMVDNFSIDYPNCTNFIGNLEISGSDVTNLAGVANVINVHGTLTINNTSLTSLLAWNNLASVTNLTLTNNTVLTAANIGGICAHLAAGTGITQIANNTTGTNNATEILAACSTTYNNANLVSLVTSGGILSPEFEISEFNYNIPTIGYTVPSITVTPTAEVLGTVITVSINGGNFTTVASGSTSLPITLADGNNTLEVKATAADGITVKTYSITFVKLTQCPVGNFALTSQAEVDDFVTTYYNCTQINGNLTVSGNVTNLNGLDNLTSVSGILSISNTSVSNIDVLQGMNLGSISISNSPISSLSALSGLTSLDTLELTNLPIANLGGLESLTTVNRLIIANNTSLTSLSALSNVISTATELVIDGNTQLTVLTGLDNLILNNTASVKITNNTQLTYAGVKSICEYIAADGNATVSNNGNGSSSQNAIQSNCYSTYYNSYIGSLVSSTGGVSPTVSWNTYNYMLAATSVNENPITITPTTSFPGASLQIKVNDGSYAPGLNGQPNSVTLVEGTNTISIKITAANGVASSTYTATVLMTQAANVLDLIGLSTGSSLSPAYSVRKLSSAYTGPAMRISTISNQQTDIGFTAQGDLDTAAILAFVQNNPALVTIWYDQSGNGINITQPNLSKAPVIANGGLVFKLNNKPVLNFSSSSNLATAAQIIFPNGASMVGIAQGNSGTTALATKTGSGVSNTNYPAPFDFTNSGNHFAIGDASTASATSHNVTGSVNSSVAHSVYAFTVPNTNGGTARTFRNGSSTGSHTINTYADNGNPLMIGNRNDLGTPSAFYTSEITLFNKVLGDTDRNTIESSQRNYYIDTSADLVNLTMSAGTPPLVFSTNAFTYNTSVNNATASVTITPTSSNPGGYGIVRINGSQLGYASSGSPSPAIALNEGDNVIEYISLSNTGSTTYTINVVRQIVCPPGNITITQQSELDDFVTLYPECTMLNGGLSVIGAADITSLAQLQNITQVKGDLNISNNPALTSLSGLSNLSNVWYNIILNNLPLVTTLAPLQNVAYVGEGIKLSSLPVTTLTGLSGIGGVTDLVIDNCDSLSDISALSNLGNISGVVQINDNALLTNVSSLQQANLSNLDNLTITNNPNLTVNNQNICTYLSDGGLNNISNNATGSSSTAEVTAACEVVASYTNLASLSTTAGALSPTFDAGTLSYSAPTISSQTVGVTASPLYANSTLSVQVNNGGWNPMSSGIESLLAINQGSNTIEVKVTAPSIGEKIYSITVNVALQCPTGNSSFYQQSAVDNFIVEYPNCTTLNAVEIGGNVTNLNGLANITTVNGTMTVFNTNNLATLAGLDNLTTITGNLDIYWNTALTNINALTNLTTFSGIYFTGNSSLSNVSIPAVCDHLANGNPATISGNATGAATVYEVMETCGNLNQMGLSSVETTAGAIANFDPLGTNFSQSVPGSVNEFTVTPTAYNANAVITLTFNGQTQTVQSGAPSDELTLSGGMNYVYLYVTIGNSVKEYILSINKTSLCPFASPYLDSQADVDAFLVDYPGCENFDGSIYISGNDITNLDGLANLVSLTGTLRINSTELLSDLGGLENLTSIGSFYMDGNAILQDITALSNMNITNSDALSIINNPMLGNIALPNICSYLATGTYVSIWSNATGANSRTEVMQACGNADAFGLSAITTSEGNVTSFDPSGTNFEYLVDTDSITITPTAFNSDAIITIYSGPDYDVPEVVASGGTSQSYTIEYGSNNFYINIAVGNGFKYYMLDIKRNTPCPAGSLYLHSQQQVDDFLVNYPTCTTIEEDLYISESGVTNLNALSNLTTIGSGDIIILNTSLQNLDGLENITDLDYMYIQGNTNLNNISALSDVTIAASGYMNISYNPLLSEVNLPNICNHFATGGDGNVYNNTSGANSNQEVLAACGIADPTTLSALTTSLGAIPNFTPEQQEPYISVNGDTITITPTAANANAQITIYNDNTGDDEVVASGTESSIYALNVGSNDFRIKVAFGNSSKNYYLSVNRLSNCPFNLYIYSQQDVDDFVTDYPNCTAIPGDIYMEGENLTDISALSNITSVSGYIELYGSGVVSLNGLQNITTLSSLSITDNPVLTDISAIDAMDLNDAYYVSIRGNSSLSQVVYPNFCTYITSGGDLNLSNNAVGGQGMADVMSACGIVDTSKLIALATSAGPVPDFDPYGEDYYITINSETATITATAQPDATLELYNFYTGDTQMLQNGVASSVLDLEFGENYYVVIVSEGNFQSEYYITITRNGVCPIGDVTFSSQQAVDDFIVDFPTCTEFPANVAIEGSDITNLDAFQNITSVLGRLRVNGTQLTTLAGLNNLVSVGASLDIYENNLANLTGLESLATIGGYFEVSNEPIVNFAPLENLTSAEGLFFQDLANLTSLSGLQNLSLTAGGVGIDYCLALSDISALSSITTVSELYLSYLPQLQSLNGLQNLTAATVYGLYISNCESLNDLSPLQNLTAVRGEIYIEESNGLTNLFGLHNIDMATVANLHLRGNTNLSNASYPNICGYLSANGPATVTNNKVGANTITEITAGCANNPCPEITVWNGTIWSNGNPSIDKTVVLSAAFTATANIEACTLTVNNNAIVTIPSGLSVTVNGKVNVQSGALSFANNARLLQDPLATTNENQGNIMIQRNVMLRRLDYVYWGSPVADMKLKTFSPETLNNRFYTYNEATNSFAVISDVVDGTPQANPVHEFEAAKGYMIRSSNFLNPAVSAPLSLFEGKFTGIPNNGNYNVDITHTATQTSKGFNMISNPYPSPISAQAFLDANENTAGTIYFWTHGDQVASSNNYATWNPLGQTPAPLLNGQPNPLSPNGIIQTGQGFILHSPNVLDPDTKANFTNSMRIDNNVNQFFRSTPVEKHRFWLNLSSTSNNSLNQALIGYMEGATEGVDPFADGILTYSGTSISSKIGDTDYITQGRSLPFNVSDVVPLTFNALTAGDYTIGLELFDGLFENQDIFLKDNLTGAEQNLKSGTYAFASESGKFDSRFSILYQTILGVENPTFDANTIIVYKDNGIMHINSGITTMSKVRIFDIRGRLIYEKNGIDSTTTSLNDLKAEQQVLLVQISSDENKTVTKKIVY